MRIDNFYNLFNKITNSYFVVENKFYKPNGESQVAYQYVAGMGAKRTYTILHKDGFGNEYVAIKDDDYAEPFCFSWLYKNKKRLDVSDYMFFNIENPKDLILQILRFLNKNQKNIQMSQLLYYNDSTKVYLKHDKEVLPIAEILTNRKKLGPSDYIHFSYRNIDVNIIPISEKSFLSTTEKYDKWVDETINNELELNK